MRLAAISALKSGLLALVRQITLSDVFCVCGFALLGFGLWEVSRSLALCTIGGLMLIIWMIQFLRAINKGG